jgi:hypothetical protein
MKNYIKLDLKLHPYRPLFMQELTAMDLNCRREECARLIQTFNTIMIRSGMDRKRLFGLSFFDGPVIQHTYLDMLQTGSCRNRKTLILKTMPNSSRTGYRYITHSLLGNTLVRFSGNVGLAVGHECSPPLLTVHLDAQTWHSVIIHFRAS